jgi:hypothetical protein
VREPSGAGGAGRAAAGGSLDYREKQFGNLALQKHGVTDGRMECAGQSDVITGMVARVGHRRRKLAAIVAAIASTVDFTGAS